LPSAKTIKKVIKTEVDDIKALAPWQDVVYMKFTIVCTLFATCFFLLFRLLPIFWRTDWHVNEAYIGMILGVNGIIVAIFEMVLVARWENKRSPFSYIVLGVLLTSVAYFLMMSPGYFPVALALFCVILISVGEMLTLPFFNGFVMKRSNHANRGQYAAAYTLTWSIAQVIGPLGGGFVAEKFGYRSLWALLAVICLGCAFAFKELGRSLEQQKVEPQRQEEKEEAQSQK
jgi:predicted MFS family arabinose efflux permease